MGCHALETPFSTQPTDSSATRKTADFVGGRPCIYRGSEFLKRDNFTRFPISGNPPAGARLLLSHLLKESRIAFTDLAASDQLTVADRHQALIKLLALFFGPF